MKRKKTETGVYTRQLYRGNGGLFFAALVGIFIEAAAALLISWLLQEVLDLIGGVDTGFSLSELTVIAVLLLIVGAAAHMTAYFSRPKFIARGISQYKEYVFEKLTGKSISAFSRENTATYISALTNDIKAIEKGCLKNVFTMLSSILTFTGAVLMMLWYSPMLTLIAVGLSLLPLIASVLTGNSMAKAEKEVSDGNEGYTALLKDSLGGFQVIKSFKAEAQMIRLFRENVKRLFLAECRRQKLEILIQMFGFIAGVMAQLGVFIFGAYLALTDSAITAGTTLVFVQLMNYLLGPIATIPGCLAERKAAKSLIEKIASALDANIREEGKTEKRALEKGITVKNLSFGYEADRTILKNISFRFETGKKYAVVGASGSGKSTLLNLLMASSRDYEGEILYDDTELRGIDTGSLYGMESIIQQNVFVFNATIRDNITMFTEFPDEEVNEAIRLSGLSRLIEEKGEDYLCGENGSGLSGGEKQRISIARSLLKKAQVLLVDEATASLDAETASQVSGAILALEKITCIVVTHALEESLLRQYDGILAFRNGEIAEYGDFDALIDAKGYFYSLFTVSQ